MGGKNSGLLTLLMILPIAMIPGAHSVPISDRIVIVMDAYHDPVLLNFTKAFHYLNDSLGGCVSLHIYNGTLNYSTLSGVAAYIVPPSNKTFSDDEKRIIRSYVARGGILILMGMSYIVGRSMNPDIVVMDDLLSSIHLENSTHFNFTGGFGGVVVDPLSSDGYVHVNSSYYTRPMRKFLGGKTFNIIVDSTILTVEAENLSTMKIIRPPKWSYVISGDGTILYFESGAALMVVEEYGDGLVIALGFALSLSDLIEPKYNASWIDIGENRDFWVALIRNALGLKEAKELYKYAPELLWKTPLFLGLTLIIVGLILSGRKKPRIERPKEVKISAILREMRKDRSSSTS